MPTLKCLAAALVLLLASPALAQTPPASSLRGVVTAVSVDGATLDVKARNGDAATVRLKPDVIVSLVIPAALNDVKPGAYVGIAALPDADGALKAMEVHVFPESMRGVGEGFRPFDLAPGSTMTNGALSARVDALNGETLIVTYAGGSKTIKLGPGTPIVSFAPGARADIKPGAAMIARGVRAADGVIDAARILVGKDGLTPPM